MLRVHSIETMGTLDGPGIRVVFFLQGCPLRCIYCHNPDTWNENAGELITPEAVIDKAVKYKPYFKDNGGITYSGGEPLNQAEGLLEALKLARKHELHTAIDTSGFFNGSPELLEEILSYTDLVILDIKHEDPKMYKEITGRDISEYYSFKNALIEADCKIWLKHVVIPGITDGEAHIKELEKEVRTYPLERVEKFELLPYHTLGVAKYEMLGMKYRLEDTKEMDRKTLNRLKKLIELKCLV